MTMHREAMTTASTVDRAGVRPDHPIIGHPLPQGDAGFSKARAKSYGRIVLLTDRPGIDTKENLSGARHRHGVDRMEVADLILPVFAVIVTGWLAGWVGYISRSLADGLVHFAYNVAMPALLVVTIAQEWARNLLEWRFLLAFGGGSVLCFALVFLAVRTGWGRDLRSSTIYGMTAAMTNTGFVALPILHAYSTAARDLAFLTTSAFADRSISPLQCASISFRTGLSTSRSI
jgi:Membrane transport protein